jgi:hypothetical protein
LLHFSNFRKKQKKRGTPEGLGDERMDWGQVISGQVRKAIKSKIIQNTKAPIHSFACVGRKFETTIFERTTLSRF